MPAHCRADPHYPSIAKHVAYKHDPKRSHSHAHECTNLCHQPAHYGPIPWQAAHLLHSAEPVTVTVVASGNPCEDPVWQMGAAMVIEGGSVCLGAECQPLADPVAVTPPTQAAPPPSNTLPAQLHKLTLPAPLPYEHPMFLDAGPQDLQGR